MERTQEETVELERQALQLVKSQMTGGEKAEAEEYVRRQGCELLVA